MAPASLTRFPCAQLWKTAQVPSWWTDVLVPPVWEPDFPKPTVLTFISCFKTEKLVFHTQKSDRKPRFLHFTLTQEQQESVTGGIFEPREGGGLGLGSPQLPAAAPAPPHQLCGPGLGAPLLGSLRLHL